MNIKFQLRCFAFVLFLCIPLTACSTAASYRDDRSAAELMTKIKAVVPSEAGYRSVESDYPDSAFGDDADTIKRNVSDWSVLVSDRSDAYPDQIMILHVDGASNQLSAVADAVRRYGDTQQTRSRDYFRMYYPN